MYTALLVVQSAHLDNYYPDTAREPGDTSLNVERGIKVVARNGRTNEDVTFHLPLEMAPSVHAGVELTLSIAVKAT